jgi:phosphate transport system substrate-binding protein
MKKTLLFNAFWVRMLVLFGLPLLLDACGNNADPNAPKLDTPTSGEVTMYVDEGYRPIIETSIDVFDSIYRTAKINARYTSEAEAVKALIDDSVEVAVLTRPLRTDEVEFFKSKGFTPRQTAIGYDAVAFITHPANRDSLLTTNQLRDIFTGKITTWGQINPANAALGKIQLVFDNSGSGNARYCRDSIGGGAPLPTDASAFDTNAKVIEYVTKNKNALGVIGANWISDTDDKGTQAFRSGIRLVDVAKATGERGYGPYQAYLATRQYPYRRTIYVINCQARAGLGLGFASFMASDSGQRILMKAGLLAANVPIRLIQVQR